MWTGQLAVVSIVLASLTSPGASTIPPQEGAPPVPAIQDAPAAVLAPIATVTVTVAKSPLAIGATTQASAVLRDASGNVLTGRVVTWSSAVPAVAMVNASTGVVTAVALGSTTLVATSEGKTGIVPVSVQIPVATVTAMVAKSPLVVGETTQASAALRDASGNLLSGRVKTWSSAAPAVATVNASTGLVTAVGVGSAILTATSEGKTGSVTLRVQVPVATVTAMVAKSPLGVGETTQASAALRDASGSLLSGRVKTWISAAPAVATVHSSTGLVTAVAPGAATLTATSEGKSGSVTIRVQVPVATVTAMVAKSPVMVGETTQASAALRDVSGNLLSGRVKTWSSAAPAVATVHPSTGLVTAVAPGSAVLTATSEGKLGSVTIRVQAPVATVTAMVAKSPIVAGTTTQASAALRDASGNLLSGRLKTWSSAAPTVATVHPSTGLVTAIAPGSATLSATSEGKTGTVTIRVLARVASVRISLGASRLEVGKSTQATATCHDASGNVLPGREVFYFTDPWRPGTATVDAVSGLVTAVGVGTVDIFAGCTELGPRYASATLTVIEAGPGAPTQLSALTATKQTTGPGQPTLQPPAVLVRDAAGKAVPGVVVHFDVTSGGGTVTGSPATTNASGVARATSWTFGPAGPQAIRASSSSIVGAFVDYSGLARSPSDGFDITLVLTASMTDSQLRSFISAKERIEEIVTGDITPLAVNFTAYDMRNCGSRAISGTVDDVVIFAQIGPIDGSGAILGRAGPCWIRLANQLPVLGHMQFDSADLADLETYGQLDAVILHEMMHVLGFGTVWTNLGLLTGQGTPDPRFVGAGAASAFLGFNGGGTYAGLPVPVENSGGAGTINSHWREATFHGELMTGYLSGGSQPFSRTTAASLADMGYTVDLSKADPFDLQTALQAGLLNAAEPAVFMGDDVLPIPPIALDEEGRPVAP